MTSEEIREQRQKLDILSHEVQLKTERLQRECSHENDVFDNRTFIAICPDCGYSYLDR